MLGLVADFESVGDLARWVSARWGFVSLGQCSELMALVSECDGSRDADASTLARQRAKSLSTRSRPRKFYNQFNLLGFFPDIFFLKHPGFDLQ